jgi:cobalt-zinc-cadmium efflux system protein
MSRPTRLAIVALLNVGLVSALLLAGLAAHSLASLAVGADCLADAGAIGVSLLAIWLDGRPAALVRPCGHPSATLVAALVNVAFLLIVNVAIAVAACQRLIVGYRQVEGLPMLVVGAIAAAVMLAGAVVLDGDVEDGDGDGDLNVRAVLLDTAADSAAAAGVVAAGAVILGTGGWDWLDPAISLAIAIVVGCFAVRLVAVRLAGEAVGASGRQREQAANQYGH